MKISELNNPPQWLLNAKVENENVEIIDGIVVWKNGTWINGTWKNGVWESGTWENGVWEFGHWRNGVWKDGVWDVGYIKTYNSPSCVKAYYSNLLSKLFRYFVKYIRKQRI